jgi:16S rRNA (uracil1498-N3)-methyltransferase
MSHNPPEHLRLRRFFHLGQVHVGATIEFDTRVSRHLAQVLRLREGDVCAVFNDTGVEYLAVITRADKRHTTVLVQSEYVPPTESPLQLHWAQCVSKGERMEYTIQKATELGVMDITPILSARVVVKLSPERWQKKLEHWRGIAVAACEQSLRVRVPRIHAPCLLQDWVLQYPQATRVIFDTESGVAISALKDMTEHIIVLAGSEGGLEQREVELAIASGYQALGFGPRVLRTETMAPAALAVIQHLWGDI